MKATEIKEFHQEVEKLLTEHFKDYVFDIDACKCIMGNEIRLNIYAQKKPADDSMMTDVIQSEADFDAKVCSLKFENHFIGSTWRYNDRTYTVIGYRKGVKNPVILKRDDKKLMKVSTMDMHIRQFMPVIKPTQKEFVRWFTINPESEEARASDVVACHKVQDYMEGTYPIESGDKFLALVDKFNDKGIAKKYAERAYNLLLGEASATIEHAYLELKAIYKEETRTNKSKGAKKSN